MMKFNDGKRDWSIEINAGSIKRVFAAIQINLSLPHEPDADGRLLCERLLSDTILQVDVLWALLEPQATAAELSIDDFLAMLGGDNLKKANDAFTEEWIDFFLRLGRTQIAEAIRKARTIFQEMEQTGLEQLDRVRQTQVKLMRKELIASVDRAIEEANAEMNGGSSAKCGDSPEKSAALPPLTPLPGGNSTGPGGLASNPTGTSQSS